MTFFRLFVGLGTFAILHAAHASQLPETNAMWTFVSDVFLALTFRVLFSVVAAVANIYSECVIVFTHNLPQMNGTLHKLTANRSIRGTLDSSQLHTIMTDGESNILQTPQLSITFLGKRFYDPPHCSSGQHSTAPDFHPTWDWVLSPRSVAQPLNSTLFGETPDRFSEHTSDRSVAGFCTG